MGASAGFATGAAAADFDFSLASSSSIEGTDDGSSGARGAGGGGRTGGGGGATAADGEKSAGASWANLARASSSALSKSGLSIQAFDCTSVTRASHRRAASMS
ncbi:hypothetical protein [Bradyrhizobium septentrionale]|uniref:Uncharacterized protein n=1 Tax=Bradyrhizobium septentrionale TaxID=1404411 RepID=A0A974A236_9BRAD|nr:hypothetical protein [Bradyrhizobium septentrionale]UGY14501.1 hypothetical protein HAP48_0039105 [Bradyrhizobium septentrionale]UGY22783.1 hypothetical protein HU675_0033105 [Bradyrhizobium septentrionale]